MNIDTAPAELFREVRELDGLLMELVTKPDNVEWHWPGFYQLYMEIDKMSWQLQAAERLFEGYPEPGETDSWDMNVAGANACLGALGRSYMACSGLLWGVARGLSSRVAEVDLRLRLQSHLHPKSSWYQALHARYDPGTISTDGRSLARTILVREPDTLERIDSPQEEFLIRRQQFDLADRELIVRLSIAARETLEVHTQVLRAYGKHFATHCRIEDLLHPSSL